MKKFKKLYAFLLSILVFSDCARITTFAAQPIDVSKNATIDIVSVSDGVAIKDLEFELYKIADMDEDRKLTATEDFAHHKTEIETAEEDYIITLGTLFSNFVLSEGLSPAQTGKTNADGNLTFNVKAGVYLLTSRRHIQDGFVYDSKPLIVYVPGYFGGFEWDYGVEISPKLSKTPVDEVYTQITVVKVWDDKGYEDNRPSGITVTLYKDKDVYDTVVLSDANDWRHTWQYLEKTYDWTVVETPVDGYTTTVEIDGYIHVITNDYNEPPKDEELPDTGLNWMPSLMLFTAGLVLVICGIIRRRTGEYEQ